MRHIVALVLVIALGAAVPGCKKDDAKPDRSAVPPRTTVPVEAPGATKPPTAATAADAAPAEPDDAEPAAGG